MLRMSEVYKRFELALTPPKFVRHKKCSTCAIRQKDIVKFESVSIVKFLYCWRLATKNIRDLKLTLNIDIGGGLGYLVFLLSKFGVKHVQAVEIASCLYLQARENLSTEISKGKIELLNADVRNLDFPPLDIKVFWVFNPFVGKMFDDFIKKISFLDNVYLIYINDIEREKIPGSAELIHRNRFLKISMFRINLRKD